MLLRTNAIASSLIGAARSARLGTRGNAAVETVSGYSGMRAAGSGAAEGAVAIVGSAVGWIESVGWTESVAWTAALGSALAGAAPLGAHAVAANVTTRKAAWSRTPTR